MIFIIIAHFLLYYDIELHWWFGIGLPLFFCISGFLHANKKIEDPINFIVKKAKKLLIPYFLFLIIMIFMYLLFAPQYISFSSITGVIFGSGTLDGLGHLWFVSYIIFCYLLTPYLYYFLVKIIKFKLPYAIIAFLLFLIFGQLFELAYDGFFSFNRICSYFIGYFLAFLFKNYKLNIMKKLTYLLGIGCVIINGMRLYVKYAIGITNSLIFKCVENYARVALGITAFLLIYIFLKNIKTNKILKLSDKYSYYIFIVHHVFILSPFTLMNITNNVYINWILVLIATIISSVILKYLSDKTTLIIEKISKRKKIQINN